MAGIAPASITWKAITLLLRYIRVLWNYYSSNILYMYCKQIYTKLHMKHIDIDIDDIYFFLALLMLHFL